ncbi:hypothetical protein E2C01_050779 [Portunus trituberculatus]|uniref:Uncharacterized protein n=1 Tax=Portunus trituberculatus TaxID=210409 RepID=A0A5B7GHD9_PORTR|nr:hypothetical protein [Portunus trituberculatus]
MLHYHHHLRLLPHSPPLHLPSTSPSHEAPLLSRSRIHAAQFNLSGSVNVIVHRLPDANLTHLTGERNNAECKNCQPRHACCSRRHNMIT